MSTAKAPAAPAAPDAGLAVAKAKKSKQPAEIPSQTTEYDQVMAQPDGSFLLQTYVHPVRVNQGSGWVPVDTTLVQRADGSVAPKAASGSAVFSGGGNGPAVTLSHGDQKLAVSWPAPLPKPVLNGASATYPGVLPGVDLQLTATSDSYTEVLVVHDAKAAANPALKSLRLTVDGTNLTVKAAADGSLSALDTAGKEVYRSPAPTMWDSSDEPKLGDKPTATSQGSGKLSKLGVKAEPKAAAAQTKAAGAAKALPATQTTEVTLTPPDTALTGPDVKYPLFIDPWFAPGAGNSSGYWVSVSNKGYNYYNSSSEDARTGYCGWSNCNYDVLRSYFNMNTSGILPRNGVRPSLTSARFYITQTHVGACSTQPTDINASGWVDGGTNWPGPLGRHLDQQWSDAGGNSDCPKSAKEFSFNVASGVQDAINNSWSWTTFGLHADNEGDRNQWKKFDHNPHLDIAYNYPPGAAGNLWVGGEFNCNGVNYVNNNTNFTVNAQATDQNPNPLPLKYWFEVWNESSKLSWNWNYAPVQTTSGAVGSWQSNYGTYPNGNYRFRAAVENVPPQGDPAAPAWSSTGALGDSNDNYNNSMAPATLHAFTVLNETMPSPWLGSYDFQVDQNGNPVWGLPQGTAGTFLLGNSGNSNTAGYSYAFDSGGSVDALTNSTCNYNSQRSAGGAVYGLIPSAGGTTALAMPSGLSVGHHTLWVKSFDAAHNMSPTAAAYEFFVSPNYNSGPVKFEVEDASKVTVTTGAPQGVVTAPATLVQDWGPTAWSNSKQVLFEGNEVGDTYSMSFNTTLDADYSLGLGLTRATDYGKLKVDLDGTVLAGTDTRPFNGYAPCCDTKHLALGGARLTPGTHRMTVTVVDTDPGTAGSGHRYWAGIDYINAVPINNATFAGFSAAMNNRGISDDANPGAANLDFSFRNAGGDVGGTTGSGNSLSKQTLTAAGLGAGAKFTASGFDFTMPSPNAAAKDNVIAMGQTITLDASQQVPANSVALLVTSTCGTAPQSSATVTYAAGGPAPDKPVTSPVPDWVAGTDKTAAYNLPYLNWPGGGHGPAARLYLLVLPANPAAKLNSVTLPNYGSTMVPGTCPNAVHVLAIGVRPTSAGQVLTSADTSAGNHPLTQTGAVSFSPDHGSTATTGGSAVFDGTGGTLRTSGPVLDTMTSFTVSAWAKPNATPAGVWQSLVEQQGTNIGGFTLGYNPETNRWNFSRPTSDTMNPQSVGTWSLAAPQLGTWTHLTTVYDNSAGKLLLYVDGVLQSSIAYTSPVAANGPLVIGRGLYNGGATNYFRGSLSDVQAYQRALTASDISTLAASPAPDALATPAGLWPLSDYGRTWIGAWATTPTGGATAASGNLFAGQTVRQVIHPSTMGAGPDRKVRVRLTNRYGTGPVTVNTASVALDGGNGVNAKPAVALTFGGAANRAVTIQAGAEVFSDPVAVSALGGSGDLAISLYLANGAATAPKSDAAAVNSLTSPGDRTTDTSGASWSSRDGWYFLGGLDVTTGDAGQGTMVVLGDQNALNTAGVTGWADKLPGSIAAAQLDPTQIPVPQGLVNLSGRSTTVAGVANSLGQRLHNWWRLADGSGTIGKDLVGANPVNFTGATWSTDHPSSTSGSVSLTGAGFGTVSGAMVDTTKHFSVSAWVKPVELGGVILSQKGNNSSGFILWPDADNHWHFGMATADSGWSYDQVISNGTVALGTWTHLTATYNGNNGAMTLYVNGQPVGSGWHGANLATSGDVLIGAYQYLGDVYSRLKGNVADVQIFREALPANDVALLAAGAGSDLQAGNLLNAGALDQPNLHTVVLALGANDLAHGDTPAVIEANIQSLVTDIKTGLKQFKRPDGSDLVHVIVTTVPAQGWTAEDPREIARVQLNKDITENKISATDGMEDISTVAAAANSTDRNVVSSAIADHFVSDIQSYVITL
ncbi:MULTISPECIES: LamG-like jellyroll fold domain-containing protein [unclassified Kitasatospora]|uniref:LamG-like jellyroll fold domain-containing protein n=1 Tax=unclassified Kitasatospora TaxID=2633591 RepID=UPI0007091971|nr:MULTISPECIES: LamG-like jellyroll fold domain-containing protein [unclassified Kitasatospora]KQV15525.1 hypothetical protein ASC99_08050 [Kitasatospora sp. Root107]KRB63888.1 hypothetical protein ASE03_04815 [Kitasatospora sp. Root187]